MATGTNASITNNSFKHLSGSAYSTYQMEKNKAYLDFWMNHLPEPDASSRELVELIATETGMSRPEVKSHLRVAAMLRKFPELHKSATTQLHLCDKRLNAIEKQVCGITDPETIKVVDAAITARLSPQAPDEALIQPAAITLHVRAIVHELDPKAASSKPDLSQRRGHIKRGEEGFTRVSLNLEDTEAFEFRRFYEKVLNKLQQKEYRVAKSQGRQPEQFTLCDAIMDVVHNNTKAKVCYNIIETPEGVTHLNGQGPLSPMAAETWKERAIKRILRMSSSVNTYVPTEEIRTLTELLDGHCRFPGCDVPAIYCEKDHCEEYDEGGETCDSNIFNLCGFHHRGKTERLYFYQVGENRELTWHFRNGTTKTTYPQGPAISRRFWATTWEEAEKARTDHRRSA